MASINMHIQNGCLPRCRQPPSVQSSSQLSPVSPARTHSPSTSVLLRSRSTSWANPSRRERSVALVVRAAAVEEVAEVEEVPKKREKYVNYNKTYYPKKIDTDGLKKPWFVVDADGQILGRMASLIAVMIRGKMSPAYSPSMDMGAFVIVINAEKVTVSGKKYTDKIYYRHTVGRPGKEKRESFKTLQNRIPERIIEHAVKGMLPKGRLGRRLFHHLKVYAGDSHPHAAQQPRDITTMINAKPNAYAEILAETY